MNTSMNVVGVAVSCCNCVNRSAKGSAPVRFSLTYVAPTGIIAPPPKIARPIVMSRARSSLCSPRNWNDSITSLPINAMSSCPCGMWDRRATWMVEIIAAENRKVNTSRITPARGPRSAGAATPTS